jgi:tetratricopeptide (TPR) repeat protein
MQRSLYFGLRALLASTMLATGCSSSNGARKVQANSDESATRVTSKEAASSKVKDEKLISAHAHYAQAVIYDMEDNAAGALEEYAKSAVDDPGNEDLVLELSRRYIQQKDDEKAAQILTRATALTDASGALFARLGMVYSRMGKDALAMEACQTAIKKSPKSLTGYQNLFLIYLQKGRSADALKVLDQAAKEPGTDAEFLVDLGELYANLERQAPSQKEFTRPNALQILRRADNLNPVDPHIRMKLADGFNVLGDSTNAVKLYLRLLNKYDDRPAVRGDVRAKLADIYLRDKDSTNATEQLKAIIQDDPANAKAYYYLGSLAYDQRKLPEAADFFHKTLLLSDDFEQAYYDLAGVQINLDQPKEAIATLDKARHKFQNGFVLEFFTGLAYSKEKDFTNAVTHFISAEVIAKATEPKRLNTLFYFQLGSAYEREGDLEQAEQYFDKCLQMSPNFPEALNYLGYMWTEHGVKLDKARELIEKAVKLEPKNAAYLDSLGWVLYKLKQPKEALENIQEAIKYSEEADATLYDHLGDVYAALKQNSMALEAWRKSLSVEPNDQVKKKLDQIKAQ